MTEQNKPETLTLARRVIDEIALSANKLTVMHHYGIALGYIRALTLEQLISSGESELLTSEAHEAHGRWHERFDQEDAERILATGRRLREHRQAKGWSEAQASKKIGISPSAWMAWECGERRLGPEVSMILGRLFEVSSKLFCADPLNEDEAAAERD